MTEISRTYGIAITTTNDGGGDGNGDTHFTVQFDPRWLAGGGVDLADVQAAIGAFATSLTGITSGMDDWSSLRIDGDMTLETITDDTAAI